MAKAQNDELLQKLADAEDKEAMFALQDEVKKARNADGQRSKPAAIGVKPPPTTVPSAKPSASPSAAPAPAARPPAEPALEETFK